MISRISARHLTAPKNTGEEHCQLVFYPLVLFNYEV